MSIVDIVVDCSAGDSGKGKVTHHLCKGAEYTHVLRFNGSGNAGHTIYHEGKRFVTHSLGCFTELSPSLVLVVL